MSTIVVTGHRVRQAVFFVALEQPSSGGSEPHPTLSPEPGGGPTEMQIEDFPFSTDEPCDHGAAKKIGEAMNSLTEVVGKVEFSAYVYHNPDGTYGAYDDKVYTSMSPSFSSFPRLIDYSNVRGMHHLHPWNSSTSSDPYINYINRYPGPEDWDGIEELANPMDGAVPADPNSLSIYITDPWGETREFRYQDRHIYEQMTDAQRIAGDNLPPPVADCP